MRLFTAIELTEGARQAIAAEQKRIAEVVGRGAAGSLKWIRPEHMHLTLVFLGEIEEAKAPAIIRAMGDDIDEAGPFAIVFGGIGMFPPRRAPRVLWLGLSRGANEAFALQRRVVERLSPTGVAIEERPFHPHLTLARWRDSRQADRRPVAAAESSSRRSGSAPTRRTDSPDEGPQLMRVCLAGTPEVAVPALDAIAESRHELVGVVTRPDAPAAGAASWSPARSPSARRSSAYPSSSPCTHATRTSSRSSPPCDPTPARSWRTAPCSRSRRSTWCRTAGSTCTSRCSRPARRPRALALGRRRGHRRDDVPDRQGPRRRTGLRGDDRAGAAHRHRR